MKKNELKNKQFLENIKADLEKECNDISLDFVGDYSLENIHYLGDCFNEFADGQISVYYSDQFEYYENNPTECENALLELFDGDSIADKIKHEGLYSLCCYAGVCGMYNKYTSELYEDEERIKKLLVVRYLLKNDIFMLNSDQLSELLEGCEDYNIDQGCELLDLVKERVEKGE